MTPEHGPRRPFAHQQLNPNFAPPAYTEGPGGRRRRDPTPQPFSRAAAGATGSPGAQRGTPA